MNPAIDLEAAVDTVTPDKKLRCAEPMIDVGGGGVNVARALHCIGGKASALFPEGSELGPFFRSLVEAEGVDCETFKISPPMRRINTHFRETDRKHQYRFCLPGTELPEGEWRSALDLLKKVLKEGDILVTSGSLPPGLSSDFNIQTAKVAEGAGADFVLDAPGEVLKDLKQSGTSWITPNRREFEDLLGYEVTDDQIEKELNDLVENSVFENILLTMGQRGALYAGKEGFARIPSPDVEKVSSVGAGDSAVAGLVLGLARAEAHRASCRKAVAAGAAAVMTPGTELLEMENFAALLDRIERT